MGKTIVVLYLPEILIYLAKYLNASQLSTAISVCKHWSIIFTPYLYSSITWKCNTEHINPHTSVILSNIEFVRSLQITDSPAQDILALPFKNLSGLHNSANHLDNSHCIQLSQLISRNPGLTTVHINVGQFANPQQLLKTLSDCPNLRSLSLACLELAQQEFNLLLQICSRLQDMDFSYIKLPCDWTPDIFFQYPNMINLRFGATIGITDQHRIEIIKRCPRLKSLRWSSDEDIPLPLQGICTVLSTTCPDLAELYFEEEPAATVSEESIVQVFSQCSKISHFSVSDSIFGPQAFLSIRPHFSFLKHLRVGKSLGMTSSMIQEIMMSCPKLTTLTAARLDARDILGIVDDNHDMIQPREWVCLNLRELNIQICGLQGKPEWQRPVMTQLARLKNLEWLNISNCVEWKATVDDGLDLRLHAGLDALGTLKRLESIFFIGLSQHMTEKDIRWCLRAWPRLESVIGKTNLDLSKCLKLEALLKEKGVEVWKF